MEKGTKCGYFDNFIPNNRLFTTINLILSQLNTINCIPI